MENRHRERDLALPKQRETLLNTIKKDLLNDENVLGVFLGGSIANNNTDLYSDIDLRIVVKDDLYEKYRKIKKNELITGVTYTILKIFLGQIIVSLITIHLLKWIRFIIK